jgi:hypothetical protein
VFELVPGDVGDPVAGGFDAAGAGAVGLEGGAGAVGFPGVELDDQALGGPEAVDLVAVSLDFEPGIEVGAGQAMDIEEGEELLLEAFFDLARGFFEPRESGADGAVAAVAWVSLQ